MKYKIINKKQQEHGKKEEWEVVKTRFLNLYSIITLTLKYYTKLRSETDDTYYVLSEPFNVKGVNSAVLITVEFPVAKEQANDLPNIAKG